MTNIKSILFRAIVDTPAVLFFASELFIIERQQESYVRRLSGSFTHTASDATVAGQRHEWSQLFCVVEGVQWGGI